MADDLPNLLSLTPLNPQFVRDPHALYDQLRRQCPVRRDEAAGTFLVAGFKTIREVLGDRTLWKRPDKASQDAVAYRRLIEFSVEDAAARSNVSIQSAPQNRQSIWNAPPSSCAIT